MFNALISTDRRVFCTASGIFFFLSFILQQQWDFYDGFVAHLASGIATRYALSQFYIYGFWKLGEFFRYVQPAFSAINTVGLTVNILLGLLGGFFTLTLWKSMKQYDVYYYFLSLLIVLLILLPTLFTPSLTGLSFLLCGAGLLAIRAHTFERENYILWGSTLVLYYMGMCIRQEGGIGASLIVGGYLMLNISDLKKRLLVIIPFAIICFFISYQAFHSLDKIPFLRQTEKALYYVSDGYQNSNYYTGLSTKDSMKAKAVEHFYINDESELTPDFINQLYQKKKATQRPLELTANIIIAWQIASKTILKNIQYLFLNGILLLLLLYARKLGRTILLFQLFFWVVVFSLAFTVKLEDRHYIYMAQLYSFCNLLFIICVNSSLDLAFRKIMYRNLAFAIGMLLLFSLCKEAKAVPSARQTVHQLDQVESEINILARDKILLLDVDSKDIFHGAPLTLHKFNTASAIVYYDMAEMPILPEYNSYLNNFCGCNSRDTEQFYDKLEERKDQLLMVSTDYRITFMHSYMLIVHHKNIHFEKVAGRFAVQDIRTTSGYLHYYVIKGID